MPSESLHDDLVPRDTVDSAEKSEDAPVERAELPVELSEFSQRLASFGLGEAPDPLLTDERTPKRRRRR